MKRCLAAAALLFAASCEKSTIPISTAPPPAPTTRVWIVIDSDRTQLDSNINFCYDPPTQETPSSTYIEGTFQVGASNDSVSVIVDLDAASYNPGLDYMLDKKTYTWTASGPGSNGPYSGYVKITTSKVTGLKSGGYADVIFTYDFLRFPNAGTFSGTIQGHKLAGGFE